MDWLADDVSQFSGESLADVVEHALDMCDGLLDPVEIRVVQREQA